MKNIGLYPRVHIDTTGARVVSQAGAVSLVETVRAAGLDRGLSEALAPWRKPLARHDPGKIVTDLAIASAVGGDCLADVAVLRAEPLVFGPVASDPTVSRLVDPLAADADHALKAIDAARSAARARVWASAGERAPDHDASVEIPVVIDIDATLVTAHSETELAAPTFKKGFGFHPLMAFADHGGDGTGEPLSVMLRKGNAGSNTAADHIKVIRQAFAQLPGHKPGRRPGRSVLVRADGAGGTHELLSWLSGQRVQYSVGFSLPDTFTTELAMLDRTKVWQPAYDGDGQIRNGAFVAEVTGLLNLASWPDGMRVILRKERPHPGAQLRITDHDGNRVTAFATNTTRGQLADLELRHRRRARCEDRIRIAKETGLRNLPLHDFDQNRIRLALVTLAAELTAWLQMLAFTGHPARRWEPKRLPCGYSPSPPGSPTTAAPAAYASPPTLLGPSSSPQASTGSARFPHPADLNHPTRTTKPRPARETGAPSDLGQTVMPTGTIAHHRDRRLRNQLQQPGYERCGLVARKRGVKVCEWNFQHGQLAIRVHVCDTGSRRLDLSCTLANPYIERVDFVVVRPPRKPFGRRRGRSRSGELGVQVQDLYSDDLAETRPIDDTVKAQLSFT